MDGFPYIVTASSLSSGDNFPHVFTDPFQKAIDINFVTLSLQYLVSSQWNSMNDVIAV